MRKYTTLLITCSLTAFSMRAYGFDSNAPLIDGESWTWLNMGLVIFIACIIAFRYLVGKLYDLRWQRDNKDVPVAKSLTTDNIYEPKYWYQCKNCRVTIRKDSMPNSADCFKAIDHKWTELAEVGKVNYLCRNCNTLIKARNVPVNDNCPDAAYHSWEKLS